MTECGYGKRVDFSEFTPHGRATGGQRIYTISEKTGEIVGLINVSDDDEVVCITSQGKTLRVKANTISLMGRAAQGVRILNIERPDMLIGLDTVANEDDEAKQLEESLSGEVSIAGELELDGSDETVKDGDIQEDEFQETEDESIGESEGPDEE